MNTEMTEARATEILGDAIDPKDGSLNSVRYLAWSPGDSLAVLDDAFSVEELEAIVWWMRNKDGVATPNSELLDKSV